MYSVRSRLDITVHSLQHVVEFLSNVHRVFSVSSLVYIIVNRSSMTSHYNMTTPMPLPSGTSSIARIPARGAVRQLYR